MTNFFGLLPPYAHIVQRNRLKGLKFYDVAAIAIQRQMQQLGVDATLVFRVVSNISPGKTHLFS